MNSEDSQLPEVVPEPWSDLLTQMFAAGFAELAALVSPPAAVPVAMAAPVAVAAARALRRRRRRQLEALFSPLREEGLSSEQVLEAIIQHDRASVLLIRAVQASEKATAEWKLRTLGKALTNGVLAADDAEIDEEERILETVTDLEAPDVQVLDVLAQRHRQPMQRQQRDRTLISGHFTLDEIEAAFPRLGAMTVPILARLSRLGLVDRVTLYDMLGWEATEFGVKVIDAIVAAGWSSAPDE